MPIGVGLAFRNGNRSPVFGRTLAQVHLFAFNQQGRLESAGVLQFWPESLSEANPVEWVEKTIPGASHPIYQWIAGGARNFSFVTSFTQEQKLSDMVPGTVDTGRTVDINAGVAWLRSLTLPRYGVLQKFDFAEAPPKIKLVFPNTKLRDGSIDVIECICRSVDPEYTDWWEDGTPRAVDVSMTFSEIVQSVRGVQFRDRAEMFEAMKNYTGMIAVNADNVR